MRLEVEGECDAEKGGGDEDIMALVGCGLEVEGECDAEKGGGNEDIMALVGCGLEVEGKCNAVKGGGNEDISGEGWRVREKTPGNLPSIPLVIHTSRAPPFHPTSNGSWWWSRVLSWASSSFHPWPTPRAVAHEARGG